MGLDAYVHCNCYCEGKTTPFPLPHLKEYMTIVDSGELQLHLDHNAHNDDHEMFEEWKQTACEHPGMMIWERISDWAGYRYFQQALEDIGWSNFPTLEAELPEANAGFTAPEQSAIILDELGIFRQLAKDRELPFLINTTTGEVVYNYVEAYQGVFLWSKHYWLGVDANGFFIAKSPDRQRRKEMGGLIDESDMLFRSMRFEQRFLDEQVDGMRRNVQYYDADTEDRFTCDIPISDLTKISETDVNIDQPYILHVETRKVDVSDYAFILNALTNICQLSVQMGHPIIWC